MQLVRTSDEAQDAPLAHMDSKLLRKVRQSWATLQNLNSNAEHRAQPRHKNSMSTPELFTIPEVKSPRLKWIAAHNLHTKHFPDRREGDECPETGADMHPWEAWQHAGKVYPPGNSCGGPTEDDALANWARNNGVRMWNEEAMP